MEDDRRLFFTARTSEGREVTVVIKLLLESPARETIRNFYKLMMTNKDDKPSYKGTSFDRIISPEFVIQGGYIDGFSALNGSLLIKEEVSAETTVLDKKGQVVIACDLKDRTESEFFITLTDLSQYLKLQGRFVVVGEVESGLDEFVEMTKGIEVDQDFKPLSQNIVIKRCGELRKKKKTTDASEAPIDELKSIEDASSRKIEAMQKVRDRDDDHRHRHRHHHPRDSRDSREEGRHRRHRDHNSERANLYRDRESHYSRSYDRYSHNSRDDYMDRDPNRLKNQRASSENEEVRKGRGFR